MIDDDGHGNEDVRQDIPSTDFSLQMITLYAYWNGEYWMFILPIEY